MKSQLHTHSIRVIPVDLNLKMCRFIDKNINVFTDHMLYSENSLGIHQEQEQEGEYERSTQSCLEDNAKEWLRSRERIEK